MTAIHENKWCLLTFGFLLFYIGLQTGRPLWDYDLFWHLALGRITLENGKLSEADPLTHTAGDKAWVQQEWLSQVLLAGIEKFGGLPALRIFRSVCTTAYVLLIFLAFRSVTGGHSCISAFFAFLSWITIEPNTTVRPHLFGWLLAALIFGLWWTRSPRGPKFRDLASLFAVMVVWVNLHSSALLVPILGALASLDAFVFRRRDELSGWLARTLVAGLATCLSPAGLQIFSYVLETPAVNVQSIEWQPLLSASTWSFRPAIAVLWMILLAGSLWIGFRAFQRRKSDIIFPAFPGLLVALAVIMMGFQYRRMIAFSFVPMLMIAAFLYSHGFISLITRITIRPALEKLFGYAVILTLLVLCIQPGIDILSSEDIRAEVYPEAAVDFLAQVQLQGEMLNAPEWGGYLSWRLHPTYRTFIDGRWLEIGPDVLRDAVSLVLHRGDQRMLDHYSIDFFIQRTEQYAAAPALPAEEWTLAWVDPVAVVLLRRTDLYEANRFRICRWRLTHSRFQAHFSWPFSIPGNSSSTTLPTVHCGNGSHAPI